MKRARMRTVVLVTSALFVLAAAPLSAAPPPDAETIMARMRGALQPAPPSTRKWEIRLSKPTGGLPRVVHATQARKEIDSGERVLTAITAPEALRGTAFMLDEQQDVRWIYAPVIDRVRKLGPVFKGEAFLHSDFSYGDLGFISRSATYRLAGQETRLQVPAYRIEEVPDSSWYYSRIVTWVAVDSFLPLQREFYDPAGRLWKRETFDQVQRVGNHATPLRIRMEDVEANTSTEIIVSDVQYNVELPDKLFDPALLGQAVESFAVTAGAADPKRRSQ